MSRKHQYRSTLGFTREGSTLLVHIFKIPTVMGRDGGGFEELSQFFFLHTIVRSVTTMMKLVTLVLFGLIAAALSNSVRKHSALVDGIIMPHTNVDVMFRWYKTWPVSNDCGFLPAPTAR